MDIENELNYCLNCKTKPCQNGCPLANDIPQIINLMKLKKYEEAYDVLTLTNVLPSICGRVCPYNEQCEGKCTRKITGNSVNIGEIEKTLGDIAIEKDFKIKKFKNYDENKKKNIKVAIVGSGPAGLTAAAFLARSGIDVTIYEKHNELGGLLYHGIPEFRLNTFILNSAIKNILDLGINIECNSELNRDFDLADLSHKYDYVFLAIGANVSNRMNIEGEKLAGVYGANELLEYSKKVNYRDKNIAVIGGGNVAIDMARTAKRKGAENVCIIYRRSEKEMPAEEKEITEAKRDGVQFLFQNNIVKILDDEKRVGQVAKIECIKTELIQKENEKRAVPVNVEGSNYLINVDMVIMAIGSSAEKEVLEQNNLKSSEKGYVEVDETNKTSISNVYAGGDLIGVKSTVAYAARSGRDTAVEILKSIM